MSDLRETILSVMAQYDPNGSHMNRDDYADMLDAIVFALRHNRLVDDAVLAAIGARYGLVKVRLCPECAGASRDANGNESRFPCGTCSAALKAEPK